MKGVQEMNNDFKNAKTFEIIFFIFMANLFLLDPCWATFYCESIFSKGQVERFIPVEARALTGLSESDYKIAVNAIRKYEADPTELIRIAHQRLNQMNVRHEEVNQKQRKLFHDSERYYLKISALGDHPLNRLAHQIDEAFGARMIYDPSKLGQQSISFYQTKENTIYLSHYQALTGQIDFTLLHEIGHVALTKKEDDFDSGIRNKVPMINGSFQTLVPVWPWGLSLPHGYKKEMSLQEFHNYRKTYLYRIIHAEQKLKNKKLTTLDLLLLRKIEDDRFGLISQEIKKMYDYELTKLSERLPVIVEFYRGHLYLGDGNLSYIIRFVIPRQFMLKWLNGHYPKVNEEQLERFILDKQNKPIVMDLILDYLESARSNLMRKTMDIERRKSKVIDLINLRLERIRNGQL